MSEENKPNMIFIPLNFPDKGHLKAITKILQEEGDKTYKKWQEMFTENAEFEVIQPNQLPESKNEEK